MSHITTLVISYEIDRDEIAVNIDRDIELTLKNSPFSPKIIWAHIRTNKLDVKKSEYVSKFHFHVHNIPVDDVRAFFKEYRWFYGQTKVSFSTYCSDKSITNANGIGIGNEFDLPIAKAGHSYITDLKCKTTGNRLVYNVCHWNFTDGAWVSHLNKNTCIRYDVCPEGFTIVGGKLCVKILKNVSWDEGYASLYQTGNEATLFDDDMYFSNKESFTHHKLHNHLIDYLIVQEKILQLWLPFKRKYLFTPLIDYSIRRFKKSPRSTLYYKLNGFLKWVEWAEGHPKGNKSCLAFDTYGTLFTDECQKKLNFLQIVNIKELGTASLLNDSENYQPTSVCPDGWKRIALSAKEHLCLKVFREPRQSFWENATLFCASKGATLVNPGKSFLNWAVQALLENDETAWTIISKNTLQNSHFDYLNWLPETNFSKRYGIISKRGWSMVDYQDHKSHLVICEMKISSTNKPLKLTLEAFGNSSVGVSRNICVRAEPDIFLKNHFVSCLKNGVFEEMYCVEMSNCSCTFNVKDQGYYQCFAWLQWPLQQVWSPYLKILDPALSTYMVTAIDNGTLFIPLDHDSTFLEIKNKSKLDSPCINEIYKQLSIENKRVELTQILFSNNNTRLQISFHLKCEASINSFCNNTGTVKEKLESLINNRKRCVLLEVRNSYGCYEETTYLLNGDKLTWVSTVGSVEIFPKEICIDNDGLPVIRSCKGNFLMGYIWSEAPHACSKVPSEHAKSLHDIYSDPQGFLDDKYSTNISTLTEESDSLIVADVVYVASFLQYFSKNYRSSDKLVFYDVVSTMNNLMGANNSVIATANEHFNLTSKLLVNFEKLSFLALDTNILQRNTDRLSIGCVDVLKEPTAYGFQAGRRNTESKIIFEGEELELTNTDSFEIAIVLPKDILKSENISKLLFVVYETPNLFNDTRNDTKLASQIIQASFENFQVKELANEGVKIYFRPKFVTEQGALKCVFWDFEKNENKGGWSKEGCHVIDDSKSHLVTCECDHLTSFALIFDWNPSLTLTPIHDFFLGTISIVGCSLSIVGMVFVLTTFVVFESFRKLADNKILANLSFAILMSMLIFVAGIRQTWNDILCRAVAVSLHYFILASFCWMFVESIHQYLKFVRVYGNYIPRFVWKAFLFAWGTPFIPIIIVLIVDSDLYANDAIRNICWMKFSAFVYSFVPPVTLILVLNSVTYAMIINGAIISRSNPRSNQDPRRLIIRQISMAICVFFLLGITWIFGFLSFSAEMVVFNYLFCFFNTSQGFFIFIFNLYKNETARRLWTQFFNGNQGSWRPAMGQNVSSNDRSNSMPTIERKQSNVVPHNHHSNISLHSVTAMLD